MRRYQVGHRVAKIQRVSIRRRQDRAGIGDDRNKAIEVSPGRDGDVDSICSSDPNGDLVGVQWRPIGEFEGKRGDLFRVGLVLQDFEAGA